jgi:hypothetical protein
VEAKSQCLPGCACVGVGVAWWDAVNTPADPSTTSVAFTRGSIGLGLC